MSPLTFYLFALSVAIAGFSYQALLLHVSGKWIATGLLGLIASGFFLGVLQARWKDFSEKLGAVWKAKTHSPRTSLVRTHAKPREAK